MGALQKRSGQDDEGARDEALECPLHVAARELAQSAVMQHVLFLEGESQPRANLSNAISSWADLYLLIRGSICPASRWATLSQAELTALVEGMLARVPQLADPAPIERFRRSLQVCAACPSSASCPLGLDPS